MSTLSVPHVPVNPRDDAIKLYKAFKGIYSYVTTWSFWSRYDFYDTLYVFNDSCYGKWLFWFDLWSNLCFSFYIWKFLVRWIWPGFGCDTAAVIGILAHRDSIQRSYIQQEYRTMYSEDLLKRLSSELSGKLEVQSLTLTF